MGAPFALIGCMAAWRQWKAPSNARIEKTSAAVKAMAWNDFARALQDAYRRDGYEVQPVSVAGADFEIRKEWRRGLVSAKRFKVARTGIEPLRDFYKGSKRGCRTVATSRSAKSRTMRARLR
jgi:restriction system protein